MSNSTSLRFGWQFDLASGMDAVFLLTESVEILCSFPVHCWVITTLSLKPHVINWDIRAAYIADQVTMFLYGMMFSFFLRPYPIFPWPGYYCAGVLCELFDDNMLSALLCGTFVSVIPFFCYLMMRILNKVTVGSANWIRSTRSQIIAMSSICILSVFNVVGSQQFAVSAESYDAPELAVLAKRKGKVIVLGLPGKSADFLYEVALLLVTNVSIAAYLTALTVHSLIIIKNRDKCVLSQKTHQAQDRLAIVFFLQLIGVGLFFVFPQLMLMGLLVTDTSAWSARVLSTVRPALIIALSLKPLAQSLIYLGKNLDLRKRSLAQMKSWLCFCSPSTKETRACINMKSSSDHHQRITPAPMMH